MLIVISCMILGIGIGYAGRRFPAIHLSRRTVTYTIWVLLFILGVTIGSDELIVRDFSRLGGQAFVLAFAGVLGSLLAAMLVYTLFFKKR